MLSCLVPNQISRRSIFFHPPSHRPALLGPSYILRTSKTAAASSRIGIWISLYWPASQPYTQLRARKKGPQAGRHMSGWCSLNICSGTELLCLCLRVWQLPAFTGNPQTPWHCSGTFWRHCRKSTVTALKDEFPKYWWLSASTIA